MMRPPWFGTDMPLADNDRGGDWIRDRDMECASFPAKSEIAQSAWLRQRDHVAADSVFYGRKLHAAGVDLAGLALADLPGVPFTTKQELQAAQQEDPPFGGHLAVHPDRVKRIYQTSGTTGSPSLIALTASDVHTWRAIGTRSYYATGIREHNSVLITFGAGPFVAGHIHSVVEDLGARMVPIGPGHTDRVVTAFERRIVDTMLTTPSYALYVIERYERSGVDARSLGLIHFITGGEPGGGLPGIRSRIEDAFAADVTEAMGLGEITPSLFGECPAKNGMHFGGDGLVWPELVDRSGHPLEIEAGAEGELVYTHLQREAMPLVRFRSGDYVKILTTDCPCGRTSFTIRISGRIDDMFIVRGVNVYPSAVQAIVAGFMPEVTGRMRVVLEETGIAVAPPVPIEVEVSDGAEINSDLPERIAATIRERLTFRASITLLPQGSFGSAAYKTGAIRRES